MGDDTDKARRNPWLPGGVALVAIAAVVVVLTTTSSEEDQRPNRPAPQAKPIELTAMPWSPELEPNTLPQLRDGTVLFYELAEVDGDFGKERRMVLADARTGAHRWTLPQSAELPGGGLVWDSLTRPALVTHPTGVAVLVGYCDVSCVGNPGGDGIALLSAQDGSMLWRAQTVAGDGMFHTAIGTADDQAVLVTVQPGTGLGSLEDLNQLRVLAFDVGTGAKRWENRGVWPVRIAGDVVLGSAGEFRPRGLGDFAAPVANEVLNTVTALDLATGAKRWDFTDRAKTSALVAVAGNAALVFSNDQLGYDGLRQVVDIRTGRKLAEFRDVWYSGDCAGSVDTTLLACATRDDRIRTFDSTDQSTKVTVGDLGNGKEEISADAVWRDRILDAGNKSTVDRAGNRIDAKLPGVIIASSGDLVLVADVEYHDGDGHHEVSGVGVYQVKG